MKICFNKKYLLQFLVLLVATLFVTCGDNRKDKNNPYENNRDNIATLTNKKIFGIQSGIIEYEITGSQTGTKKLYFEDWGRKQVEYSNTILRVGKYSKQSNLIKINNGDWQYIIDLDRKIGTKRKNPVIEKLIELKDQINYGEFGEQLVFINGGYESGSETINGRKCNVYEFKKKNSKSWIWNWITLKSEINTGGVSITMLAVNIKENVSIPDSVYNLPPNVSITEVDLQDLRSREEENQF